MALGNNTETAPGFVDINLLSYRFRFKRLFWREEIGISSEKGRDPVRSVLAHALAEVSGLIPVSVMEAQRVIDAIPEAIVTRVWKVYRGSMPPARRFSTADLYRAPEPSAYIGKVMEDEEETLDVHDRAVREMEGKFGKQEVAEEAELSRKVMEAAQKGKAGAPVGIPATKEEKDRG